MKKHLLQALIISIVILAGLPVQASQDSRGLVPVPISPTGHQVRGNQWLFVIGINTYIDWPRLDTAVNDARTVKDILIKRYHFDSHHLIELYDEKATRSNILDRLRFLAQRVGPDDSIVIFYAGHGHLDSITKSGSWIPVESGIENTSAWLSNHDIKEYLKVDAIKAKHVLLISDSCFSGDFFRGKRGKLPEVTDEVIKRAYKLSSRQAITSGGLEPVVDAGFGGNSVFTHFLVKTLKENNKPFLLPSDLFPDIKAGVAENAEQFPLYGTLKDTGGQQGGELVFFLKQQSSDVDARVKDRQVQLERLNELERESEAARKKEQAEIARKEEQLAKLDARIKEMNERLGTTAASTNDSLDAMLAMVIEKENQAKRLEELRRKRKTEELQRLAEIERLKFEQAEKRRAALTEDIRKYERIVSSEYGSSMKEAAWNNLINRYSEARDLTTGDIQGLKDLNIQKINLRSSFRQLSVSQVQSMSNMSIREKTDWGFYGHSTVYHSYEKMSMSGDTVVLDLATGHMWHQSGSYKYMFWDDAKAWIKSLNSSGYAGYRDWRLPTVEEAASLLESSEKNRDLYIDPVFGFKQRYIWTGNKSGSDSAWGVHFDNGGVYMKRFSFNHYVRPVRLYGTKPKSNKKNTSLQISIKEEKSAEENISKQNTPVQRPNIKEEKSADKKKSKKKKWLNFFKKK